MRDGMSYRCKYLVQLGYIAYTDYTNCEKRI